MFVRTDIPVADQLVQACHASIEVGARFHHPHGCHLVLLAVPNERALLTAVARLEWHNICFTLFHEPDNNIGNSAACTQPLDATQRRHLRKYNLWQSPINSNPHRGPPATRTPQASHLSNQQPVTSNSKLET